MNWLTWMNIKKLNANELKHCLVLNLIFKWLSIVLVWPSEKKVPNHQFFKQN